MNFTGRGYLIEGVHAVQNAQIGIQVLYSGGDGGGDSIVRNNVASRNGRMGIQLFRLPQSTPGGGFLVIGSIANLNGVTITGAPGIFVDCPSSIINNTAQGNGVLSFQLNDSGGCTRLGNSPPL